MDHIPSTNAHPNIPPTALTPSYSLISPPRNRATSQLSAVSVRADQHDLSCQTSRGESSKTPTSSRAPSIKGAKTPVSGQTGRDGALSPVSLSSDEVTGEIIEPGDARRGLRELVRHSTIPRLAEVLDDDCDRPFSPRRYYVLTHAGKPVFTTHDEEDPTNLMGVAQALISIFAEEDDRLRSIQKGRSRIAFLLKAPLYLFCVSDWGEPEQALRNHLEYIHLHILSVVSSTQLSRVFQRRSNFDLSRLLEGTEKILHGLIERCQEDFSFIFSTLQPLRMAPAVRDTAAAALMPPTRFTDLLYVLLLAGGHIVTLLRPRKHAIHPSDLHLLLNTLASSSALRTSETWIPICFPKFNPAGFVHAYVSYVTEDIGLVFVSADREAFEELRTWKKIVVEKLERDKILSKIQQAIPQHPYPVSALSCQGLRHFIYRSKQHIQITAPEWEAPYEGVHRSRLITLYQRLQDAVHARSGQTTPSRLLYIKTGQEACIAWSTKPFELYATVSHHLPKSAVVSIANRIASWVAHEEGRLFLKDAPVF